MVQELVPWVRDGKSRIKSEVEGRNKSNESVGLEEKGSAKVCGSKFIEGGGSMGK